MKKILFILLGICSGIPLVAQNVATEVTTELDEVTYKLYNYNDVYYKIIDGANKEVMCVDPTVYGLHWFDTWFYGNVEVNIPETIYIDGEDYTVTSIRGACFFGLTKPCVISSTVKEIGYSNFSACDEPIKWGSGVETIERNCLNGCHYKTLDLPENLKYLGKDCVNDNFNVKTVVIPTGLIYIGSKSFCSNPELESITLPSSLKTVGTGCFCNNTSLKSVTLYPAIEDWQAEFNNCPSIERIEFTECPIMPNFDMFSSSFMDIDINKCILVVPDGEKIFYEQVFSNFDFPVAKLQILEKSEEAASAGAVISDKSRVEVSRYTTDGVQVDENYKGLVIIQYSDGTTAKRFVE